MNPSTGYHEIVAISKNKLRILITAGPTREYLDSVRFISNASSGKMGYAIAREAARRGHTVVLVSGPVAIKPPAGVKTVPVITAAEMATAAKQAFRTADVAIMTAAVCDYRPTQQARFKLPKHRQSMQVRLEHTEDIAASLGTRKGHRLLVGFALEDHDARAHAEQKAARKNCDLIVLNGPANLGSTTATVELYSPLTGWSKPLHANKIRVARHLIQTVETLYVARQKGKRHGKSV